MTAFTRWIWHKTYQAFSCFPSRLYFDPECDGLSSVLWYLQISFESPMSITETTAFNRMMWHIIYQTCSCFPSRDCIKSQNAMVLVQTYVISRSHLNHRPPNVNITRHRSCSKSHEYLDQAWRDSVPGKRCCQYIGLNWTPLTRKPTSSWSGQDSRASKMKSLSRSEFGAELKSMGTAERPCSNSLQSQIMPRAGSRNWSCPMTRVSCFSTASPKPNILSALRALRRWRGEEPSATVKSSMCSAAAPSYSGSDAGWYWSMFKRCMGWLPNMNMIIEIAIPDQMVLIIRGHYFLGVKNLLRSIHVVDTLGFRVG